MNSHTFLHQYPKFEFPFKLHCLLEDAAHEGHERIVSWLPHGQAFKIHSKRQFEIDTLPRYFTTSRAPKYRSFQRQLAIYGFQLNTDHASPDRGSYSHPLMVRGKPELCLGMSRQKIKGPTAKRSSSCAAIAGSNNNQRPPLVLTSDAAAIVSGTGVLREEAAMWSSSGGCEDLVLEETVSDVAVSNPDIDDQQEHEPIPASILLRMSDDDCHKDLLAFAIHCNDYLAATMTTRSSPSPSLINTTNNLLAAFISDASLSSRDSTSRVVDDDEGLLGTTATNGGRRCSLTMSEPVLSSDQEHNRIQQAEVLNALNQLVTCHRHAAFEL